MLEELFYIHNKIVSNVPLKFQRYLYGRIDWNSPAICITGARGVGKTTLLIQHYHEKYGDVEKCLYISADHIDVSVNGLFNAAKEYFKYGGSALIIDEAHKYPEWQQELKNILDTFKDKKIFISGSSSLGLKSTKADLSRRLASYDLGGLSFREYLELKEGLVMVPLPLEKLLKGHVTLAQKITHQGSILRLFKQYLMGGYYPFFIESESAYLSKILNIIEKVLYEDVVVDGNVKPSHVPVLKKILWLLATSSSFTVNINKMSRDLAISREYVYEYINYLEAAGLIHCLHPAGKDYALIRKPQKMFLRNPNLLVAINSHLRSENEQGSLREAFFVDQLLATTSLRPDERGDFLVAEKYVVEVGGEGKTFRQVRGLQDAYLAVDGIEIGHGNRIPLYMFGFLY
ncbi:MAG: AAA family ATPase [Candidatus Omnitrophota bacterium]